MSRKVGGALNQGFQFRGLRDCVEYKFLDRIQHRVSDRGRVTEVEPIYRKRFEDLNQGCPFSLLQCRQGRTQMGGWVVLRECVCCMQ